MGSCGAASQEELGTFPVPRQRMHKLGPKVSIWTSLSGYSDSLMKAYALSLSSFSWKKSWISP